MLPCYAYSLTCSIFFLMLYWNEVTLALASLLLSLLLTQTEHKMSSEKHVRYSAFVILQPCCSKYSGPAPQILGVQAEWQISIILICIHSKALCIIPNQNIIVRCRYYFCLLGVAVVSVTLMACGFKMQGLAQWVMWELLLAQDSGTRHVACLCVSAGYVEHAKMTLYVLE